MDQARSVKFGIKYAEMDFYNNSSFRAQKGRGLGSHEPVLKLWDHPYNFQMNQAICFKFGTQIEFGALQRRDHKLTSKCAW